MKHALLFDLTKCVGCETCVVACQMKNNLLPQNQYIRFTPVETLVNGTPKRVFGRTQCMHCEKPSCVSVCTVGALQKTAEGPVVYDRDRCIGCRYCMYACPFQVPVFEWFEKLPLINKCDMCADRLAEGLPPACVESCPTNAIQVGEREEMLALAHEKIAKEPNRYINYVYGENEVGGTSAFYISGIPFEELGFAQPGSVPPAYSSEAVMHATPAIAGGMALALSAIYLTIKRYKENAEVEEAEQESKE